MHESKNKIKAIKRNRDDQVLCKVNSMLLFEDVKDHVVTELILKLTYYSTMRRRKTHLTC